MNLYCTGYEYDMKASCTCSSCKAQLISVQSLVPAYLLINCVQTVYYTDNELISVFTHINKMRTYLLVLLTIC